MLQLLQARRAKKAAVTFIAPLVAASRRSTRTDIPEHAWLTPYMVGFMGMLISLVAQRAANDLSSDVLGTVQVDAWQSITGYKQHPIGEDICILSAGRNREFETGCISAERFLAALNEAGVRVDINTLPHEIPANEIDCDEVTARALWVDYFDAHIDLRR